MLNMKTARARLYKAQKKDIAEAAKTLADAFRNDPVWRQVFAGESDFERKYRAFFETPIRYALKYGEVYAVSENMEGVAAWLPGSCSDMTVRRMLLSTAFFSGIRIGAAPAGRLRRLSWKISHDRRENMKGKEFIYLMILGVAAQYQGKGNGRRLLEALIEEVERRGVFLYLETETEDNVGMYEKFGFKTIKKITLPVIELPMWEMVREPETTRG